VRKSFVIASRESAEAKSRTAKRGKEHKAERQRQVEYISDLGDFLYFVRYSDNGGMSWSEAFLASPEWKATNRSRYGNLLD